MATKFARDLSTCLAELDWQPQDLAERLGIEPIIFAKWVTEKAPANVLLWLNVLVDVKAEGNEQKFQAFLKTRPEPGFRYRAPKAERAFPVWGGLD